MVMMSSQDDLTDPWPHPPRAASSPPPPLSREWNSGTLARDPTLLSSQDSATAMPKSQDDHTLSLRPDDTYGSRSQDDQFRMPTSHSQPDFHLDIQEAKLVGKKDDMMMSSGSQNAHEDYRMSPKPFRKSFSVTSPSSSFSGAHQPQQQQLSSKETHSPPRGKGRRDSAEFRKSDSLHPSFRTGGGGGSERSSVSSTDMEHHLQHRDFLEEAMAKRGAGQQPDWAHPPPPMMGGLPPTLWRPPYMMPGEYGYPVMVDPRLEQQQQQQQQRSGYLSLQHKDSLRGRHPPGYMQRPHPRGGGGGQYLGEELHGGGLLMRSKSHDRALDEDPAHHMMQPGPGHYPGPYGHRQPVFDEGSGMEYYLSQPTQSFDRHPPHPFHHPTSSMMGYDMKVMMGGPSGYALSQPIPVGMYGGGGGGGSRHSSGSFSSVDRKGRPHFADRHAPLNDLELNEEEELEEVGGGGGGRGGRSNSPFKRDYRTKSIYGDGLVFGKWMERLDNSYDMVG